MMPYRLKWLAVALRMQERYSDELRLPKKLGEYLPTLHDCLVQTGHNDFKHLTDDFLKFFRLGTSSQGRSLCPCPGMHKFACYPKKKKKKFVTVLKMGAVKTMN